MNASEVMAMLQDLLGQELQARPILFMTMSVLLAIMFFYLLLRRRTATPAPVEDASDRSLGPEPVYRREEPRGAETVSAPVPVPAAAEPALGGPAAVHAPGASRASWIPEDSVLRRHYVAHIKYMIETVTAPRPTDSVLRRHYEQLIASELDNCLSDENHLNKMMRRFDERKRLE